MTPTERERLLAAREAWALYQGDLNANSVTVHGVRNNAEQYIHVLERVLLGALLREGKTP